MGKVEKKETEVSPKERLAARLETLLQEAEEKGVSQSALNNLFLGTDLDRDHKATQRSHRRRIKWGVWVITVLSVCVAVLVKLYNTSDFEDWGKMLTREPCLITNNGLLVEVVRPVLPCGVCEFLTEVPIERNISVKTFESKYAYTSVPVLIKDATRNWTAMSTFSFHYIKELYETYPNAFSAVETECQFFPYNTNFTSLLEALRMPDARANFTPGEDPWYFGWSNCDEEAGSQLREHYKKPYFLPENSGSSDIDWIFMGGSGHGAAIHLDYVESPSWQAQISGTKTWTLVPVPECETQCHTMNVTVHKGDIFVINTNVWYHSTYIHPGEISITIGSEYF